MFDVLINLKEFQSRFTHPAATCDPSAWRTRRQESPRFHRGLGSPPAPCCWQLWAHLSRGTDETCWNLKPNRVFQTSILHSFQPIWFIFGSRVEPVSSLLRWTSRLMRIKSPVWNIVDFLLGPAVALLLSAQHRRRVKAHITEPTPQYCGGDSDSTSRLCGSVLAAVRGHRNQVGLAAFHTGRSDNPAQGVFPLLSSKPHSHSQQPTLFGVCRSKIHADVQFYNLSEWRQNVVHRLSGSFTH